MRSSSGWAPHNLLTFWFIELIWVLRVVGGHANLLCSVPGSIPANGSTHHGLTTDFSRYSK